MSKILMVNSSPDTFSNFIDNVSWSSHYNLDFALNIFKATDKIKTQVPDIILLSQNLWKYKIPDEVYSLLDEEQQINWIWNSFNKSWIALLPWLVENFSSNLPHIIINSFDWITDWAKKYHDLHWKNTNLDFIESSNLTLTTFEEILNNK